jgi:hypothetical protein
MGKILYAFFDFEIENAAKDDYRRRLAAAV